MKHFVNLISTNNPENPYEVEFRHNAYGDTYGHPADGLVAFKLDGILPDTNGETVKLKLIWNSYSGEKSHEFDYCTRQSTPANPEMTNVRAKNFINYFISFNLFKASTGVRLLISKLIISSLIWLNTGSSSWKKFS